MVLKAVASCPPQCKSYRQHVQVAHVLQMLKQAGEWSCASLAPNIKYSIARDLDIV